MSGNVNVKQIVELIRMLPKADNTQMHIVNDYNFGKFIFSDFVEEFKLGELYLAAKDYCCIKIVKTINLTDDEETIIYIIDENQTNLNDTQKQNIKDFKNAINNVPVLQVEESFKNVHNIRPVYEDIDIFYLKFKKEHEHTQFSIASNGGKKGGVKYTVKQLQAIASKNNIKITKKVDGKTVRLNKKGLMTKLKRYKLI